MYDADIEYLLYLSTFLRRKDGNRVASHHLTPAVVFVLYRTMLTFPHGHIGLCSRVTVGD